MSTRTLQQFTSLTYNATVNELYVTELYVTQSLKARRMCQAATMAMYTITTTSLLFRHTMMFPATDLLLRTTTTYISALVSEPMSLTAKLILTKV